MKKTRITTHLILFMCILSFSSCALLFNGTTQAVSINSMTSGSKIYVNGNYEGDESIRVKLKRKDNHTVMVKKENCNTQTVNIGTDVQVGWIVFNALFNWFAFLTDAPTGAWNSFDKTNITVELDCNNQQ